ncbi:MAG: glycosyltransferase family 4 protein [Algisphaera sp.]
MTPSLPPPRVLFVCANRLNFNGGAKVETVQLVHALAQTGACVGLLIDNDSPNIHPAVKRFTLSFAPKRSASIRHEIRIALKHFKPDVIHVIGAGVRTARAVEKVCTQVPWLITLHNLCPHEYDVPWCVGKNRRWRFLRNLRFSPITQLWRGVLRRARYANAICHSQHIIDLAIHRGVPAHQTTLIPLTLNESNRSSNPTPASLFPPQTTPRLTSVGGFSHRKGFHDAIRAVAQLTPTFPHLHYALIGGRQSVPYANALKRLIKTLGLTQHVSLHFDVPASLKQSTLAAADLYLQPSHEEGFCLAFLEAARITPRLLGTTTGAMAEMTASDDHGTVVNTRRPDLLALQAERLLRKPIPEHLLANRCDHLAQHFGLTAYVNQHLNLFTQLAQRSTPCGAAPHLDFSKTATPTFRTVLLQKGNLR